MRKVLRLQSFLIIAAIVVTLFSTNMNRVQSKTEEAFHVLMTKNTVQCKTRLIFEIPIKSSILENDWITLLFPKAFPVPPYEVIHDDLGKEYTTEYYLLHDIQANFLSLNPNKSFPVINYAENSLSFVMPRTLRIRSDETTWLWITMSYTLPNQPCEGSFGFWHPSLDKPFFSNQVVVYDTSIKPGIENLALALSDTKWNQPTSWQFTFQTNKRLKLYKNMDYVSISFGKDCEVPTVIHPEYVFINDVPVYKIDRVNDRFVFYFPATIHENQPVKMIIWEQFGIKSPQKSGNYIVQFQIISMQFYHLMEIQKISIEMQPGEPFVKISNPITENQATYSLHWIWDPPYGTDTSLLQIHWPDNFPLEEGSTISAKINDLPFSGTFNNGVVSFPMKNIFKEMQPVMLIFMQFKIRNFDYQYFINPPPGKIQFSLRYHSDLEWIPFQPVDILPGNLNVTFIDWQNRYATQPIELTIGFAANNEMNVMWDKGIYLVFSENTIFPSEIIKNSIILNRSEHFPALKCSILNQHILLIRTEKKDDPSYNKSGCTLTIDSKAGFFNPNVSNGKVSVSIQTSLDEPPVMTAEWSIIPLQEKTSLQLEGGEVGKDNWFTTPPTLKINHGEVGSYITINWIMFELPIPDIPLLEGQNIQCFYLTNDFPHKNTQQSDSLEVKVDTVPIEIKLEKPSLSWSITNASKFLVNGNIKIPFTMDKGELKNIIDQSLLIQNRMVLIQKDGSFKESVTLQHGVNDILIEINDWAGHQSKKTVHVYQGKGIILQIGSKYAWTPDKTITIDAPPMISQNRTFIPIRVVAEAFGAIVTYRPQTKPPSVLIQRNKQTIEFFVGNQTALVDKKTVTLDAPPFIHQNRIMVPLRFLADVWKMKTQWEAAEMVIAILF